MNEDCKVMDKLAGDYIENEVDVLVSMLIRQE
jgi:hypothetical protein